MFVDFDKYIKYLIGNKMSPNQFAFCWMVHHKDFKNIEKYVSRVGTFKKEDIQDLVSREYLLMTARSVDEASFNSFTTTHLFYEEIVIDGQEAFNEILDMYPPFVKIQGRNYSLTACDLDSLATYYDKKIIKGDRLKHEEIKEKCRKVFQMMEDNKINYMKIDKFIKGRQWSQADKDDLGDMYTEI